MFQYAAAKALSLRYNRSLKADLSSFGHPEAQMHEKECHLHVFSMSLDIASKQELKSVHKYLYQFPSRVYNKSAKLLGLQPPFLYYGNSISPSKPISKHKLGRIVYLEGDFQNEAFFADCQETIRNEFEFRSIENDSINYKLGLEMKARNSVALHVRRGDYVNSSIIKTAPISFYHRAISYMRAKLEEPFFYIFSDDIDWCADNLGLDHSVYFIQHNKNKDSYKDMYLMSRCRHNIIANSSFSWWGAWLNKNPCKIVIAPNEWMAPRLAKDVVPASWTIIT